MEWYWLSVMLAFEVLFILFQRHGMVSVMLAFEVLLILFRRHGMLSVMREIAEILHLMGPEE